MIYGRPERFVKGGAQKNRPCVRVELPQNITEKGPMILGNRDNIRAYSSSRVTLGPPLNTLTASVSAG